MKPVCLAITCGEPAGIGPEISLRAAWDARSSIHSVLIGDAAQLRASAATIDPTIRLQEISIEQLLASDYSAESESLLVCDVALTHAVRAGQLDPANGLAVLRTLDVAIDAAMSGAVDAIVTAPLQKSTINDAGVPFSGHTEYLAEKTGTAQVVMMLAGGEPLLRVALATTHLPLRKVAEALTEQGLLDVLTIIDKDLRQRFGLAHPRILVAGLNPHAGEGGYLGREEIDVIEPALQHARQQGMDVLGPYPADTLFQPKYLEQADCVLAMYHDQGLPVLKYMSFGRGVNITLGLPIIRTSVDHGTALDLAAKGFGHADYGSMQEAIRIAAVMARAQRTLVS